MINVEYEKMLFRNDLEEYKCSIEGKKLDFAFKNNVDSEILEKCIDRYYYARNNNCLTYDNLKELEDSKNRDRYYAKLYSELN